MSHLVKDDSRVVSQTEGWILSLTEMGRGGGGGADEELGNIRISLLNIFCFRIY